MAYDPIKAHEYYMKYRKKGLKKGRKKGSKKKKSSIKKTNLVGLSNSGLNDSGKMQWALQKEKITADMNTALSKATTSEEKAQIRQEYQNKALEALQKIKSDPAMAKAKSAKSKKSSGSSKKSDSNKSKSSSNKTSGSKNNTSYSKQSSKITPVTHGSASTAARTVSNEEFAKIKEMSEQIENLKTQIANMSEERKAVVRDSLQTMIAKLKKKKVKKNG